MAEMTKGPGQEQAARTPSPTPQSAPSDAQRATENAPQGRPAGGGQGLADQLNESYAARVTVPGAPNVDARLDNRTGTDRPSLETFPAKPQQVDGPDVAHQREFTRAFLAARGSADEGDRKGMYSPGPHGLSDEALRETGEALFGTESLTAEDAASGTPKAG